MVIIGAGQAGLSVGYHLLRRNMNFVILEASDRIGDQWRNRWDSLRLFTPAKFDELDGMRFPAPMNSFPTKNEMADYLEAYASRFRLPVRPGTRVNSLSQSGQRFVVMAGDKRFEAAQVVVAAASYQAPRVPPFARNWIRDYAASFARIPQSVAAPGGRRATGRRRQLRIGNRQGAGALSPGMDVRARCRADPVPHRRLHGA